METYSRLAREGASGILSIHIASSLSNIVNVARLAVRQIEEVPVAVVDSGQLSLGLGLLALRAAQAAATGWALDRVRDAVLAAMARTYSFAIPDTLEYLRRGGRISGLQSSLATWLQVKPLLTMHDGRMTLERIRTRGRSIARMLEHARVLQPLESVAVLHARARDQAEALREQVRRAFPSLGEILVGEVTPAIGAHVGPGALGLVCISASEEQLKEGERR